MHGTFHDVWQRYGQAAHEIELGVVCRHRVQFLFLDDKQRGSSNVRFWLVTVNHQDASE